MSVLTTLKDWGRSIMQKAGAATGIAREIKDIFELDGVPAFARFYREGVFVWKQLYRGFYEPWHTVPAPTVADPNARRQLYRLNAAKAVCAELAGLVWGEQAEVRVSRRRAAGGGGGDGAPYPPAARGTSPSVDGEAEPLNEFVQHVLRSNAFGE